MKNFLSRLTANHRDTKPAIPTQQATIPAVTPQELVAEAVSQHGAGRLAEAELLYRRILVTDAANFDALHMLGVVHLQTGRNVLAVELIERAIVLAPGNPLAHGNLGLAYQSLNRLDKAVASLRMAVALQPDQDGAQNNLGTMLCAAGQLDEAEVCFRKAVQLNPRNNDALNNLGNVCRDRGQFSVAESYHREALAIDPAAFATWKNLGEVQKLAGRYDDALDSFRKALELRPEDAGALADLGSMHSARAELIEAENYFRLALQIDENCANALCNLGDVLRRLDRLDEAESFSREAVALRPDDPEMLNTLACVLLRICALDEAEACCRKALTSSSDHVPTLITLGSILGERDRNDEAEACLRSALERSPESPAARYNLSMLKLMQGEYGEGLELYESRFDTLQRDFDTAPGNRKLLQDPRRWRGEALSGLRVLIWTEQGFGDSLMMLRYLPMLKERGASEIILFCEPSLERLAGSLSGLDHGMSCTQAVSSDAFDLHCPIMSLPFLFKTTRDSIPGSMPCVAVPTALRDIWKARLAPISRPRVGLAWAGSRTLRDDARRSISLSTFAPLIKWEGARFVSLQKGDGAEQVGAWMSQIENWMDECDDFMDTAALVQNLDLVIAVDSAVAHLAGALGKPVWLLNRYRSEWRWGLESDRSPWYPSMRIFRQTEAASWDDVIANVADELIRFQRS
ncbi:MAG: tetratricopeptide repeat protein [Betaproteobacteria bacterium]